MEAINPYVCIDYLCIGYQYIPVMICVRMKSAVSPTLARLFLHVIHMQSPDELQRTAMLQWILQKCGVCVNADLSHVAAQTSGFIYADLAALVSHAVRYVISLKVLK